MASIVMTKQEYKVYNDLCPSCHKPVQVQQITDTLVHFACDDCSFLQLYCAHYQIEPWEFPVPHELFQPTSPY